MLLLLPLMVGLVAELEEDATEAGALVLVLTEEGGEGEKEEHVPPLVVDGI
jgi:hypothetical protein